MATLPTYQSLETKGNAFEQRVINTKEDVQEFFMSNIKENIVEEKTRRFIYRGVTNSRYKIFSSAQRNFAEKELVNITTYDNLIAGTIQQALDYQDGLLRKYLQGCYKSSWGFHKSFAKVAAMVCYRVLKQDCCSTVFWRNH